MISRGRFLTATEFGRLLGDLRVTNNIFQDALLQFLERGRLVVPVARIFRPRALIIEGNDGVPDQSCPPAEREAVEALERALEKFSGFTIDPTADHPLDVAPESTLVTRYVTSRPFESWDAFKTNVRPGAAEPLWADGAVRTYYHDWQALLVADALNMGVRYLMDTRRDDARKALIAYDWPAIRTVPGLVSWSLEAERGLTGGQRWGYLFDAAGRAEIARQRSLAAISWRTTGERRYFTDAEKEEYRKHTRDGAKAAIASSTATVDQCFLFLTYLCERWDECTRHDRAGLAEEYKRHLNRAVGLMIDGFDIVYPSIADRLGRVTGHFVNTLDIIFPNRQAEMREKLQRSLQHSVVKKAPPSDAAFSLSDADTTDLLDWLERNALYKVHLSVETILKTQFTGATVDHIALAKEVESLSTTFEHTLNALLAAANQPHSDTLLPKMLAFWTTNTAVYQILLANKLLTRTTQHPLAYQLAAIAALPPAPRAEIAQCLLTAILFRNSGQHGGMQAWTEDDLHEATRIFLTGMMYCRKNLIVSPP